jgi:hypothetical protein
MKLKTHILFIVALQLATLMPLAGQDNPMLDYLAEVSGKYGSDADLVNGEKYFYPYTRAEGTPYLYPVQQTAKLGIKGKEFADQKVKFDIYNQQLVLEYTDSYGSFNNLVLRTEWVEYVDFGGMFFKKMTGPEGGDAYLQVIYEGRISCYYRWSKLYQLNLNSGVQNYYFTEPNRESYVHRDGVFSSYRNNRTFLKAFEKAERKLIKQHLKKNKLKVKQASNIQMAGIVQYCESIEDEAN